MAARSLKIREWFPRARLFLSESRMREICTSGRRPVVKGGFEDTVNVSGAVMSSAF
jgi:hypothetical protein